MKIFEKRKLWFGISGLIILVGLVFTLITGLNLGIDFTGGTIIQIDLGKTFTAQEIREITDGFDKEAAITYAGEERTQVQIKTKLDLSETERAEIFDQFKDKYGLDAGSLVSMQKVGPTIGDQLKKQAFISLAAAAVGMLLYITYRFEFKFGVAATAALLHDMLIMLAVYAVMQIPINTSFIAAVLTIVGYSINATIVVFDRIRENRGFMKKGTSLAELVNLSINQTIARSMNTSLTTLLTIGMIYILGVSAIKEFALPLIVGILSGTYSSVLIAGPLWAVWKGKEGPKAGRA
ncbi:MAG: protein translocase subunit SecF [Firmicutes bacterium]|nr:protein translocase subunit SecF [Bacillota bacterium]MDD3299028.1 protein translocase subunit SecF [Bacillota bacterium]MDD3851807.1 protein translocase subunit SecF [Bacillota bacterium]MDD4707884.1 protein translocase subunit SecF [Bacillota bacterium]